HPGLRPRLGDPPLRRPAPAVETPAPRPHPGPVPEEPPPRGGPALRRLPPRPPRPPFPALPRRPAAPAPPPPPLGAGLRPHDEPPRSAPRPPSPSPLRPGATRRLRPLLSLRARRSGAHAAAAPGRLGARPRGRPLRPPDR